MVRQIGNKLKMQSSQTNAKSRLTGRGSRASLACGTARASVDDAYTHPHAKAHTWLCLFLPAGPHLPKPEGQHCFSITVQLSWMIVVAGSRCKVNDLNVMNTSLKYLEQVQCPSITTIVELLKDLFPNIILRLNTSNP